MNLKRSALKAFISPAETLIFISYVHIWLFKPNKEYDPVIFHHQKSLDEGCSDWGWDVTRTWCSTKQDEVGTWTWRGRCGPWARTPWRSVSGRARRQTAAAARCPETVWRCVHSSQSEAGPVGQSHHQLLWLRLHFNHPTAYKPWHGLLCGLYMFLM